MDFFIEIGSLVLSTLRPFRNNHLRESVRLIDPPPPSSSFLSFNSATVISSAQSQMISICLSGTQFANRVEFRTDDHAKSRGDYFELPNRGLPYV